MNIKSFAGTESRFFFKGKSIGAFAFFNVLSSNLILAKPLVKTSFASPSMWVGSISFILDLRIVVTTTRRYHIVASSYFWFGSLNFIIARHDSVATWLILPTSCIAWLSLLKWSSIKLFLSFWKTSALPTLRNILTQICRSHISTFDPIRFSNHLFVKYRQKFWTRFTDIFWASRIVLKIFVKVVQIQSYDGDSCNHGH